MLEATLDDVWVLANQVTDFLLNGNNLIIITVALIILAFLFYYFRGRKPETTDIREMIRADRGPLEKIAFFIPVYHGYREREDRREADKVLRDFLAKKLKDVKKEFKEAYRDAMAADMSGLSGKLDSAIALFDKLEAKITHADYGYASFWGALKIREEELDRMYDFDNLLVKQPEELGKKVAGVADAIVSENIKSTEKALGNLIKELRQLDKIFDERKGFMLKISR